MAISKYLLEYVERETEAGKSKKEIKEILLSAGWHKDAISEAFDLHKKVGESTKKEARKEETNNKGQSLVETEESSAPPAKGLNLQRKEPLLLEEEKLLDNPEKNRLAEERNGDRHQDLPQMEISHEDKNIEGKITIELKKRRVRPVFLVILSFVLGAALMLALYMFVFNKITVRNKAEDSQKQTGFQAQKINDADRITRILKVQEELEKYYDEHKSYPEKISDVSGVSEPTTDFNYTYTPIGSLPQSYTLNVEMKSTDDGTFKIEGGFMTLKNRQGTK